MIAKRDITSSELEDVTTDRKYSTGTLGIYHLSDFGVIRKKSAFCRRLFGFHLFPCVNTLVCVMLITCFLTSLTFFMMLVTRRETNAEQTVNGKYIIHETESIVLKWNNETMNETSAQQENRSQIDKEILQTIKRVVLSTNPVGRNRRTLKKRETLKTSVSGGCERNAHRCKAIVQSVNEILNTFNSSFSRIAILSRYVQSHLQNENTNHTIWEFLECLNCTNVASSEPDSFIDSGLQKENASKHDNKIQFSINSSIIEDSKGKIESRQSVEEVTVEPTLDNITSTSLKAKTNTKERSLKIASSNSQTIFPTAEAFQSSQQVELKPTMTWMPYPICFYGPTQTASQSNPSIPYSILQSSSFVTSPVNQRPLEQQTSNYLQIQAQNLQLLSPPDATSPWFTPMKGALTAPGKTNQYYCTYLPAPTFQFPAIPGVAEFQRTSERKVEETVARGAMPTFANCPPNMLSCTDGSGCVAKLQWCDGHVDCVDASDETKCACKHRIATDRLCDGYFDCPHGEDEAECFGCPKNFFSCNSFRDLYSTNNCVPLSQRCDGIKQCSNGKDEEDCSILASSYIGGKDTFAIGYSEGYLHRNLQGKWYPVCSNEKLWAMESCASELGSAVTKTDLPEVDIRRIPEDTYKGPYVAEVNGEVRLIDSCANTAPYVRCPPVPCGTTVLSDQNSNPPFYLYEMPPFKRSKLQEKKEEEQDDEVRVVGGRASQPKAWPFLVAIYKDGHFHCGGAIINEFWILTAAHCLDGSANHYYEVQAGMLRRFSFAPMAEIRKARYIIIHPAYEPSIMKNDVGMIMLDSPLRFNRWIRPACLPELRTAGPSWRLGPPAESICVTIGWGATREHGPDPDHLREVEVPILSSCTHSADKNDAEICAGYPQGGRDACQGDSGGPLLCKNPYSESQWYVAGIVSHGEGCARPNKPGAYTKVSHFVDWIEGIYKGRIGHMGKVPLIRCPGFSCEGGLGKCLPIQRRCDRSVDCLNAEDETNCPYLQDFFRSTPVNSTLDSLLAKDKLQLKDDSTKVPLKYFTEETKELSTTQSNENIDFESTTSEDTTSVMDPVPTFTCQKVNQSVSVDSRCNKVLDCQDGSDESNCTCKDYLLHVQAKAICDGFVDCDDGTDEDGCEICTKEQFLCKRNSTCIPLTKKCDGVYDCPLKEDELDCFVLSNGKYVDIDSDGRPMMYTEGFLTRYRQGTWHLTCHQPMIIRNQSSTALIGQNMCQYFGLQSASAVAETAVPNVDLESRILKNETLREELQIYDTPKTNVETCPGIYIRCKTVPSSSKDLHLIVDTQSKTRNYMWPWLASLFVDGYYHCPALLLDTEWLLVSSTCTTGLISSQNYTTVLVGHSRSFRHVNGPHQQVSIVDKIRMINDSDASLIHLKDPVNITRYVQPLFFERKIYPADSKDNCVAVGVDGDLTTESVFLKPVLNCQRCHRCFIETSKRICAESENSTWSGVVFCLGSKGWYPASVFHEKRGLCSFQRKRILTSIDYINPHFTQAIEERPEPFTEPKCNGVRCNIGECIPWSRVCDKIQDCRSGEDETPENCEKAREFCHNDVNNCSNAI